MIVPANLYNSNPKIAKTTLFRNALLSVQYNRAQDDPSIVPTNCYNSNHKFAKKILFWHALLSVGYIRPQDDFEIIQPSCCLTDSVVLRQSIFHDDPPTVKAKNFGNIFLFSDSLFRIMGNNKSRGMHMDMLTCCSAAVRHSFPFFRNKCERKSFPFFSLILQPRFYLSKSSHILNPRFLFLIFGITRKY